LQVLPNYLYSKIFEPSVSAEAPDLLNQVHPQDEVQEQNAPELEVPVPTTSQYQTFTVADIIEKDLDFFDLLDELDISIV